MARRVRVWDPHVGPPHPHTPHVGLPHSPPTAKTPPVWGVWEGR